MIGIGFENDDIEDQCHDAYTLVKKGKKHRYVIFAVTEEAKISI